MASFSRFVRSGKYASGPHETDRAVATCAFYRRLCNVHELKSSTHDIIQQTLTYRNSFINVFLDAFIFI
jgi:hypothetical protein